MVDPRLVDAADHPRPAKLPSLFFAVLGPPVLWALHLSLCYVLVTLDCISAWDGSTPAVAIATALFAAAALAAGWTALRLWSRRGPSPQGDDDSPRDPDPTDPRGWFPFLLLLAIAGSVLFTAVILLTGAAPFFVPTCG